jgi:hypothetical protein
MGQLAQRFGENQDLWTVVGLCHDLDYRETGADRSQHGIVTARLLAGDLPPEALAAIEAHDHRTRVKSDTKLADVLKLADALAIADLQLGRGNAAVLRAPHPEDELRTRLGTRSYIADIVLELSRRHGITLRQLAAICEAAPPQ